MKAATRKIFSLGFKLLIVGVLLLFLGKKGFISFEKTSQAFTQLEFVIPAVLAILATNLLGVVRWQILLRAQNIHLKLARTFQLTFIGNFFNLALPGAVSGDFVKAFYVAKETDGRRGRVFGTILFDRVMGLSALVFVSAGALLLAIDSQWGGPVFKGIKIFVVAAAIGTLSFFTYLFLVKEHHDPLRRLFQKLERLHPKAGAFGRIYDGLRHYHNHRISVLKALGISIVIHLLVCFSALNFATALGEIDLAPLAVFAVVPMGLLVTAIPIMPGGIGTGHAAFGWLFVLLASQRGADVFSMVVLTQFLGGGLGGLIYLRFKSQLPVPDLTESAI